MDRSAISRCSGDCHSCSIGEPASRSGALDGLPMAGASLLTFLLPLAFALAASIAAGSDPLRQLTWALIALVVGAILGRGISRLLHWEGPEAGS